MTRDFFLFSCQFFKDVLSSMCDNLLRHICSCVFFISFIVFIYFSQPSCCLSLRFELTLNGRSCAGGDSLTICLLFISSVAFLVVSSICPAWLDTNLPTVVSGSELTVVELIERMIITTSVIQKDFKRWCLHRKKKGSCGEILVIVVSPIFESNRLLELTTTTGE